MQKQADAGECCHKTRLRGAPCPIGRACPNDTATVSKATCETHGHLRGHNGLCIMCRQPIPSKQPELTDALARLRAWVRSEAEGADLPEHYPQTHRGMMDVERLVAAVEELTGAR